MELYDPFAGVRGFKYAGAMRAVYPLSPKRQIPKEIRRPNYGREAVRPARAPDTAVPYTTHQGQLT